MKATVWLNGEWLDGESASISVFDHGFLYGDGVFEGMRAYDGRIFRLDEHMERLYDSAKAIRLDIGISREEFTGITLEALRRSGLKDAYLRHVVTRGIGDLGFDPRKCGKPTVLLIVGTIRLWPEEIYERGLKVITAGTPMPHREALSPRTKSLNYLPHVLAKIEGIEAGADEVIMMDSSGFVAEGSAVNVFIVKDGVIRTPPPWGGILKGVTRDAVIELAGQAGYEVRELPLNRYDIYSANEAFFTGTAAEIIAIRSFDGRIIGEGTMGSVTRELLELFRKLVRS